METSLNCDPIVDSRKQIFGLSFFFYFQLQKTEDTAKATSFIQDKGAIKPGTVEHVMQESGIFFIPVRLELKKDQ